MSEFDNLKNDAEQYPQQIREGEDAAEKKFGIGQQDQGNQGQGQQDQGSYGQGQQDQYGQGQQDQGQQDQYGGDQQSGY